jgi:glycosyltransferase involved in cell wall biosynthesis
MGKKGPALVQRYYSLNMEANLKKPKVSVITVTFNREAFIREAINSVLAQSFTDWELLVIDDASTDNTKSIVDEYISKDSRIKYFRNEQNLGIAKTRNRGLELAEGEYIAPLDSDDVWLDKNKLQKQVEFLDINQDYAMLGGGIMHIDANSRHIKKVLYPVYDSTIRNIILQFNPFPQSSLLYRKRVALGCGGYSESYKICDDYDLWLKMGLEHKFTNIPQVLTGYRVHTTNITHTKRLTTAREILEIVKIYRKNYNRAFWGILKAYIRILLSYIRS